jgi:hypothetical protein
MSLIGSAFLRQHVVEFIRGTGVKTDGVVDATSTNGPWTWTVPAGVAELNVDGCGAGGGGGGGCSTTNSRAGGGGGGSGAWLASTRVQVVPNASLTVTIGAKGTGGGVDTDGADGGASTIAGLTNVQWTGYNNGSYSAGTLCMPMGEGGKKGTTSAGGTAGRCGGIFQFSTQGSGFSGTANAATPSTPASGSATANELQNLNICIAYQMAGLAGSGGGGASTTGSVSGANGGGSDFGRTPFGFANNAANNGVGGTNGTTSFGGGGAGAPSPYGYPGVGGGNAGGTSQAAGNASGYGAGGGGGGGSGAGGNGSDGYIRFTYWSAD